MAGLLVLLTSPAVGYALLVLLIVGALAIAIKYAGSSAVAKDDLKEVGQAEKERQDADEGIAEEYGRLHGTWTRVRDRLRRQRDDQQVPPSA